MATVSQPREPARPIEPVPPADMLYEIVDGQFVEKPVGAYELELASLLHDALSTFVKDHRLGRVLTEMIFDLRPIVSCSRRPDVAYLSGLRWPLDRRAPDASAWPVVPDLAVEIVSPSNTAAEVRERLEEYFAAGCVHVWIIYPMQGTIYLYDSPTSVRILTRDDTLTDEAMLPGLRLELSAFFGEPG